MGTSLVDIFQFATANFDLAKHFSALKKSLFQFSLNRFTLLEELMKIAKVLGR